MEFTEIGESNWKSELEFPTVIFVFTKKNHWENYYPLLKPLNEKGIKVKFACPVKYFHNLFIPDEKLISSFKIWFPEPKEKDIIKSKLKIFQSIKNELLPLWIEYTKDIKNGLLVFAQDGAFGNRILINYSRQRGFKIVSMQDGFFSGLPMKYGWEQEAIYKKIIKSIIYYTHFNRYLNLAMGAEADFIGLYGNKIFNQLMHVPGFQNKKLTVIGSPRHAIFKKKVNKTVVNQYKDKFTILCLPTTFPLYRDKKLYKSQDTALEWLLNSVIELKNVINSNIEIKIKVKYGYNNQIEHYQKMFNNPMVKVLDGSLDLVKLFSDADIIITTGSTAALEAALCNIPVLQIAPPYLSNKLRYISELPVAYSYQGLLKYMEYALTNDDYFSNYCNSAQNELADINSEWNSIEKATDWLADIAYSTIK